MTSQSFSFIQSSSWFATTYLFLHSFSIGKSVQLSVKPQISLEVVSSFSRYFFMNTVFSSFMQSLPSNIPSQIPSGENLIFVAITPSRSYYSAKYFKYISYPADTI